MTTNLRFLVIISLIWAGTLLTAGAQGTPPIADLISALQRGGYVLVMRHAASPQELPTAATARPGNTTLERQLDEAGRTGSLAMGKALRSLKIPIGAVLTSPTLRARETVTFAELGSPSIVEALGDAGQSMAGVSPEQVEWLRTRAAEEPQGGNVLLVTHSPNLGRAFPDWGASMAEGEMAIIDPDGRGGATLLGRIKIQDWPAAEIAAASPAAAPAAPVAAAAPRRPPTAFPAGAGREMVLTKCSVCHDTERILKLQQSRDEWVATLGNMKFVGAKFTPEEEKAIVDYLAEHFGY